MEKNAVCLITFKPNDIWIDFLKNFNHYDIFVIIDDNSIDYINKYKEIENITFIQLEESELYKNGFIDVNFITLKKRVSGWDKALYYFSLLNKKYKNIWFFEDDVFFYDENTLLNIDSKYINSDLLTNNYDINENGNKSRFKNWLWFWINIDNDIKPPYYSCMCCATRISINLLNEFKNYAEKNKILFFLEALFPTICKNKNLLYDTPEELKYIIHRYDYNGTEFDKNHLYHPIKNIEKQVFLRNTLLLEMENK